ncbi:MAG: preprotein translocase subunit SecY [Actinomycetota bacterium]
MLEAVRNLFRIPELRKRLLFTLFVVAIYRLGAHIVVPGVDTVALQNFVAQQQKLGGLFGFVDLFAGGALSEFAVFALGIMPYITASIIMQLMTVVIPRLEQLSKEGEAGQKKINQYTRYLTVGLALIQSSALVITFNKAGVIKNMSGLNVALIIITLVAGTTLIMWLAELITENGIGNGMSIIIATSIISQLPVASLNTVRISGSLTFLVVLVLMIVVTAAIVATELGQRKIPVQYAKRIVGRKVYGGQMTYIPLKINQAGVIPIIFAVSVMMIPNIIIGFFPGTAFAAAVNTYLKPTSWVYMSMYTLMIVGFAYFYTAVTFNPIDIAENIQKYGGFIPGVRPGRPTAQYLDNILTRMTLPGAIFLALIALIPTIIFNTMNVSFFKDIGGISLLIVVGVALESMRQLEAQLAMRNYEGFFS